MATRSELVLGALAVLSVEASGQPASPEDFAKVDSVVNGALADLRVRGIYYVPDPEEIDDAALEWLSTIVAMRPRLASFGAPVDLAAVKFAESQLREMQHQGPTSAPVRAVYY